MRVIEVAAIAVTSLFILTSRPVLAATLAETEAKPAATALAAPAVAGQPNPPVGEAQNQIQAPTAPATANAKRAEPPKPPAPSLIANVNLTTQTMTVAVYGKTVHSWKVSSGAFGYATPVGTFKPDWMSKMWYSKQYDDAPMPHSVFFKNGAAIHGTTSIGRLGTAASHGCVRLSPANAEAFYKLVGRHGLAMTRIAVSGRAPVAEDRIARRDGRSPSVARSQYQPNQQYAFVQQPTRQAGRAVASQPRFVPSQQWSSGYAYPGERSASAYPAGSLQVNRTPYWAR